MKFKILLLITSIVIISCSIPVEVQNDLGNKNAELVQQLIDDHNPLLARVIIDDQVSHNGESFLVEDSYFVFHFSNGDAYYDLANMLSAVIVDESASPVSKTEIHLYMD